MNGFDPMGNSWLSKLWDDTVLKVSQGIGKGISNLQRWSNAHPIAANLLGLINPIFALTADVTDAQITWAAAQRNPQIAGVVAAVASWYIGGALGLAIDPALTATEETVIAGASAGFGGGFVGARASGASLSQAFTAAAEGGAIGGTLAFAGSEWFHVNPPIGFNFSNAAQAVETSEIRYEVGRFAENELGISGVEFDGILEAVSFAGNYLLGNPNGGVLNNQQQSGIAGFLDRVPSTGILFQNSELAHEIAEFPFDVADTLLQYQGLPDATDLKIMWNGSQPTFGHSLGALRFSNLAAWGVVPGGSAYALPFGMIAPAGVSVFIGSNDPITGWSLGQLFNPDATVLPTNHFMGNYNAALGN